MVTDWYSQHRGRPGQNRGIVCEQIRAAGTSRVSPSVLPVVAGEKKRLQRPSSRLKGEEVLISEEEAFLGPEAIVGPKADPTYCSPSRHQMPLLCLLKTKQKPHCDKMKPYRD